MTSKSDQAGPSSSEEVFVSFVLAILAHLKSWAEPDGVPQYSAPIRQFTETGWGQAMELTPDYWALIRPHMQQSIMTMEEVDRCARKLWDEGTLKPVAMHEASDASIANPTFEQMKYFLVRDLLIHVVKSLRQYKTFSLTKAQATEIYEQFKAEKTSGTSKRAVIIPLKNFNSQVSLIGLDPLGLSAFTPEDKTLLWNTGPFEFTVPVHEFINMKFKLSGSYDHDPAKPTAQNPVVSAVAHLVTAFRLLKSGDVGVSWTSERGESPSSFGDVLGGEELSACHVRTDGTPYSLLQSDEQGLRNLYKSIEKLAEQKEPSELEVSLRRFNQAYSRKSGEDRIIDLTISLENTLLAGDSNELKYRLALRGAALLRRQRNPADTKSLLFGIYDIRSAIVHGGRHLTDSEAKKIISKVTPNIQPSDLPQHCEELVRQILKEYIKQLSQGKTLEMINMELDQRVVDGLREV